MIYRADDQVELRRIDDSPSAATAVVCLSDGRIVTGHWDGSVEFRDADGTLETRRRVHRESVLTLGPSADGRRIASGGADDRLRVWNVADGSPLFELPTENAEQPRLSISRQCQLLDLPRSTCYYVPAAQSAEELALMRRIDRQYLETPFYGSRRMAVELGINRKRARRLMQTMGLEAVGPGRRTTQLAAGHKIYPYLLRNLAITRPDQVWSSDIRSVQ